MRPAAILFDFDGVLIESEHIGNRQIAETLTALGHPTTLSDVAERFTGLNGADYRAALETWVGGPVPPRFHDIRAGHARQALDEGLDAVAGAVAFVRALPDDLPRAVASSSSTAWIATHLAHLGLTEAFGDHLYSGAEHVARGKPAPDLYLHAADRLGVPIADTVILEDSPIGARGAVASGARVIGLCAGRHCGVGHAESLRALGAHRVARSFAEVAEWLALDACADVSRETTADAPSGRA